MLLLSSCHRTSCFDPNHLIELIETFELETLLESISQLENQMGFVAAEGTVNRANDCLVEVILRELPNHPSQAEIEISSLLQRVYEILFHFCSTNERHTGI